MPVVKLKAQNSKLKTNWKIQRAFTLIELLVVISIMAILIGLSIFGLQGARKSSRDSQRKADLGKIRSALESYKADCGIYPQPGSGNGYFSFGNTLTGSGSPASCSTGNTYIQSVPTDPLSSTNAYGYNRISDTSYELCASLETVSGSVSCGSANCGAICNYKVTNP